MIRVYEDQEALSRAAAELFAREVEQSVARQGRCAVLLAGGETPRRCYELLAGEPFRSRVPWHAVHFFWGDERCVPDDDPRNNAGMARRALLDRVPVPSGQVHAILCDRSPAAGAAAYEEFLHTFFAGGPPRFDLVFLGLGGDGHTASLFPGSPVLEETERWVVAAGPGADGLQRVTVTLPLLNLGGVVVFLVAGAGKAAVLREVTEEASASRRLPASMIRPDGRDPLWLTDREAGRLLKGETERPTAKS